MEPVGCENSLDPVDVAAAAAAALDGAVTEQPLPPSPVVADPHARRLRRARRPAPSKATPLPNRKASRDRSAEGRRAHGPEGSPRRAPCPSCRI